MFNFKLIVISILLNISLLSKVYGARTIAVLGLEYKKSCLNEVPLKSVLETESNYIALNSSDLINKYSNYYPNSDFLESEKKCKHNKKRLINLAKQLNLDLIITGRIHFNKREFFRKDKESIIELELINVENGEIEARLSYVWYDTSSLVKYGVKFALRRMLVPGSYRYSAEDLLVKKSKKTLFNDTIQVNNWQKNRYLLTSSGYGLDKGQMIMRRIYSLVYAEYGISKNLSISGGNELISMVLGKPIWFVKPKATTELYKNVNLSVGLLELGMKDEVLGTLGSTSLTLGSTTNNITFGVLFDRAKKYTFNQEHTYTLSAIYNFDDSDTQRYLIFESFMNFNKTQFDHFSTIGYRLQNDHKSFECGFMFSSASSEIITPYISYSWNISFKN